jgi:hypothetical protein
LWSFSEYPPQPQVRSDIRVQIRPHGPSPCDGNVTLGISRYIVLTVNLLHSNTFSKRDHRLVGFQLERPSRRCGRN